MARRASIAEVSVGGNVPMTRVRQHYKEDRYRLDPCVRGFVVHRLKTGRCTSETVQRYCDAVFQLVDLVALRYLDARGVVDWRRIDHGLLVDYVATLGRSGYAGTTTARKIVALRSFFAYLAQEEVIETNPAEGLTIQTIGLAQSTPPQRANNGDTVAAYRNAAMRQLYYTTEMGVGELAALNLDSLDLDNGVVRREVRSPRQTVPISPRTVRHLREYVDKARPILAHAEDDTLFLNNRGQHMTRQGIWLLLKSGS